MFNIYDLMKSGMSAEEIASAFSQSLNEAEARVKAEEEETARLAEEAARAEQARISAQAAKCHDFKQATGDVLHAVARHYPELGIDIEEVTDDAVAALAEMILMLLDLEAMKHRKPQKKVEDKRAKNGEPADPFMEFFKQFGL